MREIASSVSMKPIMIANQRLQESRNYQNERNRQLRPDSVDSFVEQEMNSENEVPLIIPTEETKERIKTLLSIAHATKQEKTCLVCDELSCKFEILPLYGFSGKFIDYIRGIVVFHANPFDISCWTADSASWILHYTYLLFRWYSSFSFCFQR
jgi:hypothetical protein